MKSPNISRYKIDRAIGGEVPQGSLSAAEKQAQARTLLRYQQLQQGLPSSPLVASMGAKIAPFVGLGAAATGLLSVAIGLTYLTSEAPIKLADSKGRSTVATPAAVPMVSLGPLQTLVATHVKSEQGFVPFKKPAKVGDVLKFKLSMPAPQSVYLYVGMYTGSVLQNVYPAESLQPKLVSLTQGEFTIPVQYFVTKGTGGIWFAASNQAFRANTEFEKALQHRNSSGSYEFSIKNATQWIDHHFIELGDKP